MNLGIVLRPALAGLGEVAARLTGLRDGLLRRGRIRFQRLF